MTTMPPQRIASKRMSESDNDECVPECSLLEFWKIKSSENKKKGSLAMRKSKVMGEILLYFLLCLWL